MIQLIREQFPDQSWGHLQHEILYLSWALMDAAVLTPLALAMMSWGRYWPQAVFFMWLLLIQLLAFNTTRLFAALRLPISKQRPLMVISLLLTYLLTIWLMLYPASDGLTHFYANIADSGNLLWLRDLLFFVLMLIMWWRGIKLATRKFHLTRAGSRLRTGVLLFILPAIWYTNGRPQDSIIPFILLFFLMGLTAVALVRAEEVATAHSGHAASLRPRWLLLIFGAAWGTVTAVGIFAAAVSGQIALLVSTWMAPVWTAVFFLWETIKSTMLYLLTPLLLLTGYFVEWIVNLLNGILLKMGVDELPALAITSPEAAESTPSATEEVLTLTSTQSNEKIITLLLMAAGVLFVTLFLGRLFREATIVAGEGRDSERQIANQRLPRMNLAERMLNRLGLLKGWKTAVSIRRLYQQMEKTAAHAGYPRAAAETPYEYQATLAQAWPEHPDETAQLTAAYVNVRYGELPENEAELDALKQAWGRLKNSQPSNARHEINDL